MNARTTLHTETSGTRLRLLRDFRAPPAAVFKAWTDPAALAAWWGPKGFETRVESCDVHPGGRFHFVMVGEDGKEYPVFGTFVEISPPHRLVIREDCASMGEEWMRKVAPDDVAAGRKVECIWTLAFEDHAGGTRFRLDFDCPTPAMLQSLLEIGMEEGWGESFDKLDALLSPA